MELTSPSFSLDIGRFSKKEESEITLKFLLWVTVRIVTPSCKKKSISEKIMS